MNKYILSDNVALRSWELVPYAYYLKGYRSATGLKRDEYELLKRCDGAHDIEDSPLLNDLLKRRLCRLAKDDETLSAWQQEKKCDNRYFPAMNWMITGKCNYNCLHCFNAADNNRLQSEFTIEEAERLIEEAERCGINAFTITGGEPMLHPHFLDIIRSIYSHGMYVEELNTNGYFIKQEILDELKKIGCRPLIKISFDGVGHHDWLRNKEGAQDDALRAMRLCIDNGFRVMAQTNVHRLNLHTMLPTAKLLNDMGVSDIRIIRTTEVPRWAQNSGDACLTFEEYYDGMFDFLEQYIKAGCDMTLDIWQVIHLDMQERTYNVPSVACPAGEYRDSLPVCRGNRAMVAVSSDGNLYPCHQISGCYREHDFYLGNVKSEGLQKHLQQGDYLDNVCTAVKEVRDHNEKCAACKWFQFCCGGCRAIGLIMTGNILGYDPSKCLFFNGGYMTMLQQLLCDYKNLSPIVDNDVVG